MSVAIPQSTATLALDDLFDKIVARTAERLDPAPACHFGWREAPKQVNQGTGGANRIVLMPGDPNGKVGDIDDHKNPGRTPGQVATMSELGTLYLWAYDASAATDARVQWRAVRRLHDVVIATLQATHSGRWKQVSKRFLRPDLERPFGAEIELVFTVSAMVPGDLVPQVIGGTKTAAWTINGRNC